MKLYSFAGQTIFQVFRNDGHLLQVWESYPKDAIRGDGEVDRTRAISRTKEEYEDEQSVLRMEDEEEICRE